MYFFPAVRRDELIFHIDIRELYPRTVVLGNNGHLFLFFLRKQGNQWNRQSLRNAHQHGQRGTDEIPLNLRNITWCHVRFFSQILSCDTLFHSYCFYFFTYHLPGSFLCYIFTNIFYYHIIFFKKNL